MNNVCRKNLSVASVIFAGLFCCGQVSAMSFKPTSNTTNVAVNGNTASTANTAVTEPSQPPATQALFCPETEELTKSNLLWVAKDGGWTSFTESAATKITSFLGAQWYGIKVGKVICLYQTNEAVAFPIALEQTRNQSIVEPKGAGWSALVKERKFCKSVSVADCPFLMDQPKDLTNIYQEIEYSPSAAKDASY